MAKPESLEFLEIELQCDQLAVKINAVHRIPIVMELLTQEQKSKFLEPLLENIITGKLIDDELLYAIARVIRKLSTNNPLSLVKLLEMLAAKEETVVRQEAVNSIISLAKDANPSNNQGLNAEIVSLVERLIGSSGTGTVSKEPKEPSTSEVVWAKKVSGIEIIPDIYSVLSGAHRFELAKRFIACSDDETPMVIRSVVGRLGSMLKCVL